MTTSPTPRNSSAGIIDPFDPEFSAFVFKIQANMNKAHRDRITSCVSAQASSIRIWKFSMFRAIKSSDFLSSADNGSGKRDNRRSYAGDIIGVFDPGIFAIGDTICSPRKVRVRVYPDLCT